MRLAADFQGLKDRQTGKLELSHLDKVFFSEAGYTKGDLIDYYQQVSKYILPYILNRPHNLLRQPNGYDGKSFFQKDMAGLAPDWTKTVEVFSESNHKNISYFVCDSLDSLLYMVQLGCIEINPWNSTVKNLGKPDWAVIDLDPEDIGFKEVIKVAKAVKQVADDLKVPAYPKTSGKSGIHIFIPLQAKYEYRQARQLAEIIANLAHQRLNGITSLERSPADRQKRIYLDYLQNRETQTLVAPYSVRPTKAASVSTPLHWDEVNSKLDASKFTIKTMPKRLAETGDIWKPVLGKGVNIAKVLKNVR
jgi:bifunctional non-homologous end joining protein LigD